MTPLALVKAFDVFLYGCAGGGPSGVPLTAHELVFQATPKALHAGLCELLAQLRDLGFQEPLSATCRAVQPPPNWPESLLES